MSDKKCKHDFQYNIADEFKCSKCGESSEYYGVITYLTDQLQSAEQKLEDKERELRDKEVALKSHMHWYEVCNKERLHFEAENKRLTKELEQTKAEGWVSKWKINRNGEGIALNSLKGKGGVYVYENHDSIAGTMLFYFLEDIISDQTAPPKAPN